MASKGAKKPGPQGLKLLPTLTSARSVLSDPDDLGHEPVCYRRVFLDDEDLEVNPSEDGGGGGGAGDGGAEAHRSDDNSYSDDHERYSTDNDHEVETQQDAA